ncbi:hypothetical protein [Streptomyces sp. NPDC005408]|uniref:hypothetical protein n=1 Tax=Streptomyces sp. NPDC005408 TaxID=3155341 RepID=UPI0033BEEEC7
MPATGCRSTVVVDATRPEAGLPDIPSAESVRAAARNGGAVLIVTTAAYRASAADRVVHLNRPPQPATRADAQRPSLCGGT